MKLFTAKGELLTFDKFDELLGVFRVLSYDCYAAEDTNESITILLQEVRRPDYELYYITFILDKEEEFLLEVDKSHKFLCYSFLQHVQIELGREAAINIAQHRFNVLPLAPCKIRIPEGPSVYLLIRIPQAAYSSKAPFKLPYCYPGQYDRIYWAADSYRHDTIIRALGCFMFRTFLGQKGLKILDEGIHLITQSSLNYILFKGADYNN